MTQPEEMLHAQTVIRRVVDDTLKRIGRQTPGARRVKAAAAAARATADDCRDAGDLVALHRFCREQIDAYEQLAIAGGTNGVLATSTLKEIQRELELGAARALARLSTIPYPGAPEET